LHDARHIIQAKKAIKIAFEAQIMDLGFSIVELLSTCPTNWHMTPIESCKWVRDKMVPYFPVGDYKVVPELNGRSRHGKR
jgi:2-oxoglutarate ferredoxin oxidoreductase subunit beta